MEDHILNNLRNVIKSASNKYNSEYAWQDVRLTQGFQDAFQAYLEKNGYEIEFFTATSVITTSLSKYIFVPNEWFVIASYAVPVYKELMRYKSYIVDIVDRTGEKLGDYAKRIRDNATAGDKMQFVHLAEIVIRERNGRAADEQVQDACGKLWRFVNDYSWWSGQKTIDRTDFFVSVILNMLNLVNVSQGYVADITSAYANDPTLDYLVSQIGNFTIDFTAGNYEPVVEEDDFDAEAFRRDLEESLSQVGKRPVIKLTGTSGTREIKIKKK